MALYTKEVLIYRKHLSQVNMNEPANVYIDDDGNLIIIDGNHRGFLAATTNQEFHPNIIGSFGGKVTDDPDYHPVTDLKLSDAEPPFEK